MFDEGVLLGDQLIVNRLQSDQALFELFASGEPLLPLSYFFFAPAQRGTQFLLELFRVTDALLERINLTRHVGAVA